MVRVRPALTVPETAIRRTNFEPLTVLAGRGRR